MGRFKHLVDSPTKIEAFKDKYHIPQEVVLRYCSPEQIVSHREEGEVITPMIAFIKGGMTLPMGRITQITSSTIGYAPISVRPTYLGS